jgi:AraC-like DNA-binding protein
LLYAAIMLWAARRCGAVPLEHEPVPVNRTLHRSNPFDRLGIMTIDSSTDAVLSGRLLAGLRQFRAGHQSGTIPHADNLFSYCALERERLVAIRLPHPLVGVVVSGAKEVWRGDNAEVLAEGSLFAFPANVSMDILNVPDEHRGLYQSLIVEVTPKAISGLGFLKPQQTAGPNPHGSYGIRLTPQLVDAVVHAASEIAGGVAGQAIRTSRLTELLALLAHEPAARPLFDLPLRDRLALLLGEDLAYAWTAAEAASRLGVSESTLRRRLSDDHTTFRSILRAARMGAAHRLLQQGHGSQAASAAVGYASRTHFARHFRAAFGVCPSHLRQGQALQSA